MSYSQFVASATCFVADDFDVDKFVESLADFALANKDSISDEIFYDLKSAEKEHVLEVVANYVRVSGGNVLVECDTEEINNNGCTMDWIVEILAKDYSVKPFVRVNSVWIDSRTGVEPACWLIDKTGKLISLDDIVSFYEKHHA